MFGPSEFFQPKFPKEKMRNIGVGVCLLVVKEKKLLVAERTTMFGKGYLSCPGGHQERKEKWEQTAYRELVEEAGGSIKVEIKYNTVPNTKTESNLPVFVTNNVLSNDEHYVTIWLKGDWQSGDPINSEPDKKKCWIWLTLEEITDDLRMKKGKEAWLDGNFNDALHWMPLPELYRYPEKLGI